jgi:hypothetical protein
MSKDDLLDFLDVVPLEFLAEFVAFLMAERTGQVTFHVLRGETKGVDCNSVKRSRDIVA